FQQSFRTASPMGPAGLLGGPTTQVGPKTFLIGGPHTGQRRLGQTFFSGSAQPTFGSGGVPHGQIQPGPFIRGFLPHIPQRRLGFTPQFGSAQPTFGQGGVPWGAGRAARTPLGPPVPPGWA